MKQVSPPRSQFSHREASLTAVKKDSSPWRKFHRHEVSPIAVMQVSSPWSKLHRRETRFLVENQAPSLWSKFHHCEASFTTVEQVSPLWSTFHHRGESFTPVKQVSFLWSKTSFTTVKQVSLHHQTIQAVRTTPSSDHPYEASFILADISFRSLNPFHGSLNPFWIWIKPVFLLAKPSLVLRFSLHPLLPLSEYTVHATKYDVCYIKSHFSGIEFWDFSRWIHCVFYYSLTFNEFDTFLFRICY